MANNTGLRIQNTTENTITVDLLDQGQTGDSVPKPVTQAKNGVEDQIINPTNAETVDNPFYVVDGVGSLTSEWATYSSTKVATINALNRRNIIYDDATQSPNFLVNSTLSGLADQIMAYFGIANATYLVNNGLTTTDIISVQTSLEMRYYLDQPNARIQFIMNYKVDPFGLDRLISEIRLGVELA
jgi:hypothetical protein